jgi:membrane protein
MTEMRPGDLRELSTGELVAQMSAQVSRLVRDELRLAQAELRQKGKRAGIGAGLTGTAGVLALLGLGGLEAAAIAALAMVLPVWACALIIGAALLLLAGVLGLVGSKQLKRGVPPIPEQAIASVQRDAQAVKEGGRREFR